MWITNESWRESTSAFVADHDSLMLCGWLWFSGWRYWCVTLGCLKLCFSDISTTSVLTFSPWSFSTASSSTSGTFSSITTSVLSSISSKATTETTSSASLSSGWIVLMVSFLIANNLKPFVISVVLAELATVVASTSSTATSTLVFTFIGAFYWRINSTFSCCGNFFFLLLVSFTVCSFIMSFLYWGDSLSCK